MERSSLPKMRKRWAARSSRRSHRGRTRRSRRHAHKASASRPPLPNISTCWKADMQTRLLPVQGVPPPPGRLESAYIFIALLLVTQALEPLLLIGSSGSDDALSDSNPASLLSALAIYAVALVILLRHPRQMLDTVRSNLLLVAVFALPVLSIAWSVDPGTTFRRAAALLMTGVFCIYI